MNTIGSKENYNAGTNSNKVVRESVLMRLNYNYKSRYYFTFTGRYDGSSNFAENNKWGFFPRRPSSGTPRTRISSSRCAGSTSCRCA